MPNYVPLRPLSDPSCRDAACCVSRLTRVDDARGADGREEISSVENFFLVF